MAIKDLAQSAADEAFKDAIRTAFSALMTHLILAKDDQERADCLDRHHKALELCGQVHKHSSDAITKVFT
jgi:hypothetical protein